MNSDCMFYIIAVFRHLSWDLDEYTVVVKSTHNKMAAIAREVSQYLR